MLKLPFAVVHGSIAEFVLLIPWSRLLSEPVRVEIRGITVVVEKSLENVAEVRGVVVIPLV